MIQSLLIKLFMLGMTMGVVFWIGWNAPQVSPRFSSLSDSQGRRGQSSSNISELEPNISAGVDSEADATKTAISKQVPPDEKAAQRALLDLNRANATQLEALPGIGFVLAQRVIAYRNSVGGFRNVEELRHVKGVGSKKFERIKHLVKVTFPQATGKTERHA